MTQALNPGTRLAPDARMRYHILATDYDGTIATGGIVDEGTATALQRLSRQGLQTAPGAGVRQRNAALAQERVDG